MKITGYLNSVTLQPYLKSVTVIDQMSDVGKEIR
jgi:hypothetical protein